jgi:hypothetical protein
MEKRKIILPEKRFHKASSEDQILQVNFEEGKSLLTNDDRDIILDINELFGQERNDSKRYKLYGKIKMVFRNMYSGLSSYLPLSEELALVGDGDDGEFDGYLPYNEFAFLRNDVYREKPNDIDVSDLSTFTGITVTKTGDISHQLITPMNAPYHNWNIHVSYVYDHDENYPMKYTLSGNTILSFVSGNGIPFRITDNNASYRLTSPVDHGMSEGEFIILNGYPYYINSIGNEYYNSELYVLDILKSQIPSGTTTFNNTLITGKRCIDTKNISGTTSTYYVHKHKTATNSADYILDKAGFESPIFEDERKLVFENISGANDVLVERNRMESVLYDFKEPFVLTGLTNNLNYEPTDLYVTILFRNGNGYFDYPPKVGWKFNLHNTWIDNHFNGSNKTQPPYESGLGLGTSFTKSGITFTSGNTIPVGTVLTGAFIEYNPSTIKERVISESMYRLTNPTNIFNFNQSVTVEGFSGATSTNMYGVLYQPHYRVKIRELSPYIETSSTPDIENLPQNARYFPFENVWKWRDVYDYGYSDDLGFGVDYPFLNNTHYVRNDINFYMRNEKNYQHKADGIFDFNAFINRYNNKNNRLDRNNSNTSKNC